MQCLCQYYNALQIVLLIIYALIYAINLNILTSRINQTASEAKQLILSD